MKTYSTIQVAKLLGIASGTFHRWIREVRKYKAEHYWGHGGRRRERKEANKQAGRAGACNTERAPNQRAYKEATMVPTEVIWFPFRKQAGSGVRLILILRLTRLFDHPPPRNSHTRVLHGVRTSSTDRAFTEALTCALAERPISKC